MKYLERLLLLLAAVMLAGTNKCREDYFFATQARVAISPTSSGTGTVTPRPTSDDDATPSPTPTEDPDITQTPDPDEELTPTPLRTITITPVATATSVATATVTTAALTYSRSAAGLLGALKTLDQADSQPEPTVVANQNNVSFGSLAGLDGSWLGNMHKKSDEQEDFSWSMDSDKDGFVDGLEGALGTDIFNPGSFPSNYSKTNLSKRISTVDSDFDGLSNEQELQQGTEVKLKDTDADGIADGLEFLSGTNPLNINSVPFDADGDGLSDDYEISEGINSKLTDTDGDGLNDGLELEIGSNVLVKDSDLDGIFDGREYQLGSDPLISDFPNQ